MLTIEQSDTLKLAVYDSVRATLDKLEELMNNPNASVSDLDDKVKSLFNLIDSLTENPNA